MKKTRKKKPTKAGTTARGSAAPPPSLLTAPSAASLPSLSPPSLPPSYVVGVGGSAGSLEPLERFFKHLPTDTTMSFVVVTHRDPRSKGMMVEILSRFTTMRVCEITEGATFEQGVVYVVPSDKHLHLTRGRVVLRDPHGEKCSIDMLFRAIAADRRERGVGIVLSGMGSDGAAGLVAMKEHRGTALVQDPTSAAYDAMPRAAIAAGVADFIGTPETLAETLDNFFVAKAGPASARVPSRSPSSTPTSTPTPTPSSRSPLDAVLAVVRARTGNDFSQYKKNTLRRRIERRMALLRVADTGHYLALLAREPEEVDRLLGDLLIGVTSFFRDPEVFKALKEDILPSLLARHVGHTPEQPLRAWVAGCATGEEAYSLAIAISESWEDLHTRPPSKKARLRSSSRSENGEHLELPSLPSPPPPQLNVQIYATDLDESAIARARKGSYASDVITKDVSRDRLARFFVKEGARYRVKKAIRDMVVFATQNIASDPPFTKLDLLSCRNVLIYLEPELQRKLLPLFLYALKPGGILILGTSEGLNGLDDGFTQLGDNKIFERCVPLAFRQGQGQEQENGGGGDSKKKKKKKNSKPSAAAGPFRSFRSVDGYGSDPARALGFDFPAGLSRHRVPPSSTTTRAAQSTRASDLKNLVERMVVEQIAPPVIVVNKDGELLYASRPTGRYFQLPAGTVTTNVLAMAREGLALPLRTGLRKALSRATTVRQRDIHVYGASSRNTRSTNGRREGPDLIVDLTILPLHDGDLAGNAMISFSEHPKDRAESGKGKGAAKGKGKGKTNNRNDKPSAKRDRAALVRLREAKTQLDALMSEMRRSEEAINLVNDELQSTNEELQSTNEELQSTNEELTTSKEEMQSMNEELLTLNAELQTTNEQLATTNDDMRNLLNSSKIPTLFLDNDLRLKRYTEEATRIAHLITSDVGRPITDLAWSLIGYTTLTRDVKRVLDTLISMEMQVTTKSGAIYTMQVHPYRTIDDVIDGVVITFMDITMQKREAVMTQLEERKRLLERVIARWPGVAWVEELSTKRSVVVSHETEKLLGYPRSVLEAATDDFWQKLRRPVKRKGATSKSKSKSKGKGKSNGKKEDGELQLRCADGTIAHYRERTMILASDPDDNATHVLHFLRRRQAQQSQQSERSERSERSAS